MATIIDEGGPLILSNGGDYMYLRCNDARCKLKPKPKFTVYPTGGFKTDFGEREKRIHITELYFYSHANYKLFMQTIFTTTTGWQYAGGIDVDVKRDSALANDWDMFEDVGPYNCMIENEIEGIKDGRGDDDNYSIALVVFRNR